MVQTDPILDVAYTDDDRPGGPQRFDLHRATPSSPDLDDAVLVYLHGGGWRAGDKSRTEVPRRLAAAGLTTVNANYTLTPDRPYPQNVEDVFRIVEFLHTRGDEVGLGDRRIFLGGASSGGHLASLAVTKGLAEGRLAASVSGVVSWFAPLDPASRYLLHRYPPRQRPGSFWDRGLPQGARGDDPFRSFIGTDDFATVTLRDALDGDPRFHLDRLDPAALPPFLLVAGSADSQEIRDAQRIWFDALRWVGAEVDLLTVQDADHEDPRLSSPIVLGGVVGFVRAQLAKAAVA
jgi:acetyl esterase/lipase